MTIYSVLSAISSSLVFLLTTSKASVKQTNHKASNFIKNNIEAIELHYIYFDSAYIYHSFLHFLNVYKSEATAKGHLWSRRYKQRKACDWETFIKPISNKLCSSVAMQHAQSSLQCKARNKGSLLTPQVCFAVSQGVIHRIRNCSYWVPDTMNF
jgi:hypothetical protein